MEPNQICVQHISYAFIPMVTILISMIIIFSYHCYIVEISLERKKETIVFLLLSPLWDHQLVTWLETWIQRISMNPPLTQLWDLSTIHNRYQGEIVKSYSFGNKDYHSLHIAFLFMASFGMNVVCMLNN